MVEPIYVFDKGVAGEADMLTGICVIPAVAVVVEPTRFPDSDLPVKLV